MHRKFIYAISMAVAAIVSSSYSQAARADVILSDVSRGAYTNAGVFGTGGSGLAAGNYLTGPYNTPIGSEYRSFFGFNLTGVTGQIIGASITFGGYTSAGLPNGNGTGDPTAVLGLFDFTGNYSALITGTGGVAAFNDLGSGTLYANPTIATTNMGLVINLDSAGLADLNAAEGGNFALGGALIGASTGTSTFGGSFNIAPLALLTLKVAEVPEPVTLSLFGTGVVGAVAMRRRKRKAA